jgi:hypothetical protein
MKHTKKKKAQSSLEFVSITSFMFLVFIATFVTIEGRMSGIYQERLYKTMDELSKVVAAEIRMAEFAPGDYEREFFLPYNIGGYNYSIEITDKAEVTIRSEDLDYVVFLDQNVSGDIGKGKNSITKTDDEITVSNLCLGGPESDDPDCGIIDCSGYYQYQHNVDGSSYSCYNKTNIYSQRCEDQGKCKKPNSISCSYYPAHNNDDSVYTCTECQEIVGCSGNDIGSCSNLGTEHTCNGGAGHCNGIGQCST